MTYKKAFIDTEDAVDLTNCDREPIHLLGGVQSFGCLISTSADFMINHVSANVQTHLNIAPEAALGGRLEDLFPARTVSDLRAKLQLLDTETSSARLFGYDALGNGDVFDISVHAMGQSYVFEFEPKIHTADRDEMSMVQPLVAHVRRAKDLKAACEKAAMAVQAMSGFDRVMVYRFDSDGTGDVIAEARQSHMEPFLGLRYPASDIPQQARALYLRATLRLISDVRAEVSPIVPQTNVHGAPLDLSLSVTRAVSPIHLEYLRNMGVAASMSVSIIKNGQLWGLFACHHETPRYIDFERRTAIELFAQFFSYELIQKIDIDARQHSDEVRQMQDNLMIQLSGETTLINGFEFIAGELSGLIANDGIAVYSDGQFVARGEVPNELEFRKLVRFLNTAPIGEVFATHHLAALHPETANFDADVAGILAVPISRTPRDYIVFFRREVVTTVKWAGNPNKPVEVGPNGPRLTPRKSFEAWSEMVKNTSVRWTDSEIQIGESLRTSLTEIVLKLTDDASKIRRKAADTHELLIAELNHRVRNILNLIQGLVSQSRSSAQDVETYTEVLDGRVQALARAHDQLTRQDWSPTSLRRLIDVEFSAYLNESKDCLNVTGDAPLLLPNAFSTLALVIHELVTNSAKYGALKERSGHVSIDLRILNDGGLRMTWREIGGPSVQVPSRLGFGTTIIEKTIPYELKGEVHTRYAVTGFEADIILPSTALSDRQEQIADSRPGDEISEDHIQNQLSGDVLIVEDNMVIALNASDILTENGADKVHLSGTVRHAMQILKDHPISFALLDVNLGDHTVTPVAKYLAAHDIPFILATGYGDTHSIATHFPQAVVVSKPFTVEILGKAIHSSLNDRPNERLG